MKPHLSEKGAAAVEFALVLPLLLAITFGLIEFGLLMYNQQVLTNAAREGARFGIVQRDASAGGRIRADEIERVARDYLSRLITFNTAPTPRFDPATVVCASPAWDPNGYVTVSISLSTPYLVADSMIRLASLGTVSLPLITLSTQSVMKCE